MANIIVLFCIAFAAGLLAFFLPKYNSKNYKLLLVFAGSYLFSITILHILPELFHSALSSELVGVFILAGFFLQQGLEYFSNGVEHGHVHVHHHGDNHRSFTSLLVLSALFIHAFFEGGLLTDPQLSGRQDSTVLFWGIALHKAPEAFALMSVLLCEVKNKTIAIVYLFIFSMASPAGLFFSDYLLLTGRMPSQAFIVLFALVAGSFLHISTTIVFESSPEHKFNGKKMAVALAGALVSIAAEYFI
jgi:zinc and cadmium transporter